MCRSNERRGRLPDPAGLGRGGDGATPADLEEEAQPARLEGVNYSEVDTFARSAFEDTRRKAAKFGAMGSTLRR